MQSQLQPSIPQDMNMLPVYFKVFTLQHIISLFHPPAYASHSKDKKSSRYPRPLNDECHF